MSLSASQYNDILEQWMKTPDGRKYIEKQAGLSSYSEEEMRQLALELQKMVVAAYKAEVKTSGADYFDESMIRIGKPVRAAKGRTRLRVIFDSKGLSRRSLYIGDKGSRYHYETVLSKGYADDYFTGKGVYDIFGLFTQGYSTKPVYGSWWDNQTDNGEASFGKSSHMRSLPKRQGSDFITRTIREFTAKYPSVEVEYPRIWGGTK